VTVDKVLLPVQMRPLFPSGAAPAATVPAGAPPMVAVGLVFYWGEGAPQEILDGVPRLLRPLPGATPVHPVPYGEGLPAFVTPRTAADLRGGDLDLLAPIPGRRPVLARAIDFGARELLNDRAALPYLFIVTDGVDHEQRGPMAFLQLGRELRRRGLLVTVISFPPATVEGQTAALDNVAHLASGAGGRHLAIASRTELAGYLEGAGLCFLDASVATLRPALRLTGGTAAVAVSARIDGASVEAAARVWLPGSSRPWLFGAALGLLLAVVVVLFVRADRAEEDTTETEPVQPEDDPDSDVVYSPPGQREPHLPLPATPHAPRAAPSAHEATAAALAALAGQPLEGALVALRGRLGDEPLRVLAGWSFAETAAFLRRVAPLHPGLVTLQGRQWLLAVQDSLARDGHTPAVAWLVRTGGPGLIGETLPVAPSTRLPGGASIVARGRGFALLDGEGPRALQDGEAFAVGPARYVFKSVA
jgi:hypothetical protein